MKFNKVDEIHKIYIYIYPKSLCISYGNLKVNNYFCIQ